MHDSLAKTILQGTIQGTRRRGRQKKSWFDNVKEWTNHKGAHLLRLAESIDNWGFLVKEASSVSPQRASTTLTGWVSEWVSEWANALWEVHSIFSQRMISGLPMTHCTSYVTQALCKCLYNKITCTLAHISIAGFWILIFKQLFHCVNIRCLGNWFDT